MKRAPARPTSDVEKLQRRLDEAEDTLEAIRSGQVDAFLMRDDGDDRVFELAAAGQPYRALIESMQQGALMVGADGVVLFANRYIAQLLGTDQDALIATPLLDCVAEADRARVSEMVASAESGEQEAEIRFTCREGRLLPTRVTMSRIGPTPGHPRCVIVQDLTERREFEALVRTQQALRESEARLREADRRKDEFLATLAHELRNPLVPLRNGLKIMEMARGDPQAVEKARDMMRRQLRHMVRLIDDLLDVSRITLGKIELQMDVVSLESIVNAAIEAAQPLLDEAGHYVSVTAPAPLAVQGDAVRLTQVLTNLLSNAAKYTPSRGRIDIVLERAGDDALIRVRDNGRGISPEVLSRIFDLFNRGGTADGPEIPGLGVGLSISRQLIGLHGGTIEAASEGVGKGSEFVVRLPLADRGARSNPQPALRPVPGETNLASRRRVLVAEDNVETARSMAMMLRLAGHDVREAHDGPSAFELADWFRPHLALLDLRMPGLDGLELARRIRAQVWGTQMRIVGVTGWGPQPADAMKSAGLDEILFKPVEPDTLLALVTGAAPDSYPREG